MLLVWGSTSEDEMKTFVDTPYTSLIPEWQGGLSADNHQYLCDGTNSRQMTLFRNKPFDSTSISANQIKFIIYRFFFRSAPAARDFSFG